MTKEIISKVSEELKAQGINASDAQIESALNEVMSKQELTEDALDNVAGGGVDPSTIIKYAPAVIDVVKKVIGGGDKKEDKKDGGNSGGNDGGDKINVTQPNNNEKSNQLTNVTGDNTQTTNTFTFN